MTVYLNNPAGRLHALITVYLRNSSGGRPHEAWFGPLEVPGTDLPGLLRRLALVLKLPGEIEAEVARVDPKEFDLDSIMRWQPRIVEMLPSTVFPNVPPQQLSQQNSALIAQQADAPQCSRWNSAASSCRGIGRSE